MKHTTNSVNVQMQICCQLHSGAHDALVRVQGGNPFTPSEQLEGLTLTNERFISMMNAWGICPNLQGPAAQQAPIPPQYTGK